MAYSTSLITSRSGSIRPRPLNEATSAKKIVQFCPVQRAGRGPAGPGTSTAEGTDGADGAVGADGADGTDGAAGQGRGRGRDRARRRITGSRSSVSRSYTWRSSTSRTLG
jgi:hypothetical protein